MIRITGFFIVLLFLCGALPLAGQVQDTLRAAAGMLQVQDTARPSSLSWPEYRTFTDPVVTEPVEPKSFYVQLKSTSYFKNNEYKNDFLAGYSLTGLYFEPVLEFNLDRKTSVRVGAHLLKYFGRDQFDRVLPVISIRYNPNPHFSMIFGTLYGTTSHGLPEPVYDFEKYLTDNYENGIQLLWNYPVFRGDVWLNWEQYIKNGDPFQEIFTAGANTVIEAWNRGGLQLSFPFAILFRHTGGEIDSTNLPAGTQSNMILGFRAEYSFESRFLKSAWFNQQWIEFFEVNPGQHINVTTGRGNYLRAGIETRLGSFEAGYWYSNNYIAPHGMPLFQSVSLKDPAFYMPVRELLTLKYELHKPLTSFLDLAIRVEPYYHFYTGRMDHSWSIYLKLNERFFLGRLR